MAETRDYRCKACRNTIYFVDVETLSMLQQGRNVLCPICHNDSGHTMEPVAVIPLAEHAALVALKAAVESDEIVEQVIRIKLNIEPRSTIAAYRGTIKAAARIAP